MGLKILKLLKKLVSEENKIKNLVLFSHQDVIKELNIGITHENTEVRMRFMELICYISNYENIHENMKNSGLLQKALDVYLTDDILLKLSTVEVLSFMGDSKWNS